jgi:hypothetical protein
VDYPHTELILTALMPSFRVDTGCLKQGNVGTLQYEADSGTLMQHICSL